MSSNSIFNSTVCIMGILILSVHLIYLFSKRNKRRDEKVLMDFFVFTIFHFAVYLTYTLLKVNYSSDAFIIAFYTAFYIMNNIEAFLLFRYARSYIEIAPKTKKALSIANYCIFCVFILLDLLNIFTRMFFTANAGEYVRGNALMLAHGYQLFVFATIFTISVMNKKLTLREKAAFCIYCLVPLLAIVLQSIFKGYAIAYASIIVAIEILFLVLNMQKNNELAEKMTILDSMAGIYDNVNLIDFINSTETDLRTAEQNAESIDMNTQSHTLMNQRLKKRVMPNQLESFCAFTNITTVRERLAHKKIISADFMDITDGWFRAQYITVEATAQGVPTVVIYTTRNIDEEKRREEDLIRISMTDEMTRLLNRRCYDEDLNKLKQAGLEEDFVIFSIDVNGLKQVNDTKGHAAGDELIKGAATSLALSFENSGKVYRTGGDEFMALIHTLSPEAYREKIHEEAAAWNGVYSKHLSLSVGYATHKENADATVEELECLADKKMYLEKEQYYKESGVRR